MIKLTSKYDEKKDVCNVKADIKSTNTLEHLYAIAYLTESIVKNDETTSYEEIIKILDGIFKKEGKKNGKRNSKSKTKI